MWPNPQVVHIYRRNPYWKTSFFAQCKYMIMCRVFGLSEKIWQWIPWIFIPIYHYKKRHMFQHRSNSKIRVLVNVSQLKISDQMLNEITVLKNLDFFNLMEEYIIIQNPLFWAPKWKYLAIQWRKLLYVSLNHWLKTRYYLKNSFKSLTEILFLS